MKEYKNRQNATLLKLNTEHLKPFKTQHLTLKSILQPPWPHIPQPFAKIDSDSIIDLAEAMNYRINLLFIKGKGMV